MTHKDEQGNVWFISEPDGRCEICGAIEETRPYGPNGEQICFSCGQKDEETTIRKFYEFINGVPDATS